VILVLVFDFQGATLTKGRDNSQQKREDVCKEGARGMKGGKKESPHQFHSLRVRESDIEVRSRGGKRGGGQYRRGRHKTRELNGPV